MPNSAGHDPHRLKPVPPGLRMPIGTDLVLHEHADAAEIVLNGRRLGQVTEEAAGRYGTPLAVPLMDLRLEKADLLDRFGVPEAQVDAFHFDAAPSEGDMARPRSMPPSRPAARRISTPFDTSPRKRNWSRSEWLSAHSR